MSTRVAIIQGSPRPKGNTEQAARYLAGKLEAACTVSVMNLPACRVRRCIGCRRCMADGVCAIRDDDFPALWEDILQAKVIVQACPVYWLAPPGIMKDFIDRTHTCYRNRQTLVGKRGYLVTVAADSGFETCEAIMGSWVTAYGCTIEGSARLLARECGDLERRAENLRDLDGMAEAILSGAAR